MTSTSTDRRQGLNSSAAIKVPCRAATTGNIVLSGLQTVDGIALAAGDRVLVKNQTSTADNGIYNVDTGTWTRALDFDGAFDVLEGTLVEVLHGTINTNTLWKVTTATPSIGSAIAFGSTPLSPSDSSNITYVPPGAGAVQRTLQSRLRDSVSAFDYMTDAQKADVIAGTMALDVSAALTAAGAYAASINGTLWHPRGFYRLDSPVTLYDNVHYVGVGGYNGSVMVGNNATAVFTYASLTNAHFYGLSLRSNVAACVGFKQTNLAAYTSNSSWAHCYFSGSLTECIYGNLILCNVGPNNTFGFYGAAVGGQTQHRHIYSKGAFGAGMSNQNFIHGNRFYAAFGVNECIYWEEGQQLFVHGNDFEANTARALTVVGVWYTSVNDNWMENCANAYLIDTSNSGGGTGSYEITADRNFFHTSTAGAKIFNLQGNCELYGFKYNSITGSFAGLANTNTRVHEYFRSINTVGAGWTDPVLPIYPVPGNGSTTPVANGGAYGAQIVGSAVAKKTDFVLNWSGVGPQSTGLNVNGGTAGGCWLVLFSCHTGAANASASAVYMVRCGHDGNNYTATLISGDDGGAGAGLHVVTFTAPAGILTMQAAAGAAECKAAFICSGI